MKLFQEAGVVHFIQLNGFALTSQKIVFVPFHTITSQNTEVHIRVNGQSIFASNYLVYLGVHFTRWGRMNGQVVHNARNASRAFNVIKVLLNPWLASCIVCAWAFGDACSYQRSVSVGGESQFTTRHVHLHRMLRLFQAPDWEATQHGTPLVYKKPGSVRSA